MLPQYWHRLAIASSKMTEVGLERKGPGRLNFVASRTPPLHTHDEAAETAGNALLTKLNLYEFSLTGNHTR